MMVRPILSAIASALTLAGWARAYKRASARAKAAEERAKKTEEYLDCAQRQRDAMSETACRMRDERDAALYRCGILSRARDAALDERDAAGFAHASALRDIAEARRMAGMPATASPQDIVRALLARQN